MRRAMDDQGQEPERPRTRVGGRAEPFLQRIAGAVRDRLAGDELGPPFPAPPRSVDDAEGRSIQLRGYADGVDAGTVDALTAMYVDFDPAQRAQGTPPVGESAVSEWLDSVLAGVSSVAWHDERAVGHVAFVPDGTARHELAIFVHQAYQGAGIGTELVRLLLGHGASQGAEKVWLTVERWNRPAVSLYESQGFETTSQESFELEMSLRLDAEAEEPTE